MYLKALKLFSMGKYTYSVIELLTFFISNFFKILQPYGSIVFIDKTIKKTCCLLKN